MGIKLAACPHCGGGHNTPCYAIYQDGGYHCFSCGKHKSKAMFTTRALDRASNHDLVLTMPSDVEKQPFNFPLDVLMYLHQYSIGPELISKYKICYSPTSNSLFLPVYGDTSNLLFLQERMLTKKAFKTYGRKQKIIIGQKTAKTIIFVEDYFSAIRLAGIGYAVYCLFGTHLDRHYIRDLLDEYENFVVWLDDDVPGIRASKIIQFDFDKQIAIYNTKYRLKQREKGVMVVRNQKEPKHHTDVTLKFILQETILC